MARSASPNASPSIVSTRCVRTTADARDRAQFILGAVSLVIWLVLAFTLAVKWYIEEYTAQPILMAGGVAFAPGGVPWVAPPVLFWRVLKRRGISPAPPLPPSRPTPEAPQQAARPGGAGCPAGWALA